MHTPGVILGLDLGLGYTQQAHWTTHGFYTISHSQHLFIEGPVIKLLPPDYYQRCIIMRMLLEYGADANPQERDGYERFHGGDFAEALSGSGTKGQEQWHKPLELSSVSQFG